MSCLEYLSLHRFKISAVFKGGIRGKKSAVLCFLCVVNYTVLQRMVTEREI